MHSFLSRWWKSNQRSHAKTWRRPARAPLQVRALEPRWTPSGLAAPSHVFYVSDGPSLQAAVQSANAESGTSEIILQQVGTYSLTGALNVSGNLIITGANASRPSSYVIEPGTGVVDRVMNVTGTSTTVVLEGLTLQGGSATGNGGAIDVTTTGVTLELGTVIVQNNRAENGAGVYLTDASNLTLYNASFLNNTAGADGGGVFFNASSQDGTVLVERSTFNGDMASGSGGGMMVQGSAGHSGTIPAVDVTLVYTSFVNNTASVNGGGLWASDVSSLAAGTITVTGNTAIQEAGGFGSSITALNGGTFALTNSYFSGNKVNGPGSTVTPGGGGVAFDFLTTRATGAVTALMDNDTIVNNSAVGAGGGMLLRDTSTGAFTAAIAGNTFSGNSVTYTSLGTVGGDGGGMNVQASGSTNTLTFTDDTFVHNTADINGGGMYLAAANGRATLTMARNNFDSNAAGSGNATTGPTTDQGDGGGLMAEALVPSGSPSGTLPAMLNLTLTYTTFLSNSATNEGGGLWASNITALAAGTVTASNNTSVQDAGGIGDSVSSLRTTSFALVNAYLGHNMVSGAGSSATPDGGGLCFDFTTTNATGTVTALLEDDTVVNNSAAGAGAGMFLRDLAASTTFHLTVTANRITGNTLTNSGIGTADGEGGGLYIGGQAHLSVLIVSANTVGDNTASTDGGGMFLQINAGSATLRGNTWDGNTASTDGGAMYLNGNPNATSGGTINITGDEMLDNNATSDGGGLFVNNTAIAHLLGVDIENNSAGIAGGGIFNNNGTLTLENSFILHNTAPTGPNVEGSYTNQGGNTIE